MSNKRILVVGSGGREHAICRALATASPRPQLIAAPGNAGIAGLATCVATAADDIGGLVQLAQREAVDMVVVGPEVPLVLGLADSLQQAGIPCCGPSAAAAQLEGSKIFTRTLAQAAGVPSPRFVISRREAELAWALDSWGLEGDGNVPVVKADGLAAGKGVFLPDSNSEALTIAQDLLRGSLGDAGREVVLEERLVGVEASLFFACVGEVAVPLPHAQDHKRLLDDDRGPNTGGMGAVSPNPAITPALLEQVQSTIVSPVLRELARRDMPFRGFLFVGLMLTESGPKLLEFNVRLGDPEAQAILPRLGDGVFLDLCSQIAEGTLKDSFVAAPEPSFTCAVVLAALGYPQAPQKGDVVHVTSGFATPDRWLDHAGTSFGNGKLVVAGGRVAAVVARGASAQAARQSAYVGVQHVSFRGMQFRHDIGGM